MVRPVEAATPLTGENKQGRLLLVDDEENILRSLRRVLRRGDWLIETAADGEAGLAAFERFGPAVVISDFRMPGMNGVEFLTRVKELSPHTQRIMLTGQADQQAIEEAINQSEVFRFITKPWNDQQLLLTVKSAFEQHELVADNRRLHELTAQQNVELRQLNADLEQRVHQRTQMLSRAKREWELSFDTIDSPLAVVNTDDLVLRRANIASARVSGREVTDLKGGVKCHQFLFDRATPCSGCPIGPNLKVPATLEVTHETRSYVAHLYPMDDEPIAVCHYRDVTDERALTRRLIESEKMIAIGNLAGGVAHEINNPLGGILAFSQLMKRDAERTPQDLEALDLIEESAMRCKRIVESLLKFSRRSKVEDRRAFDLSKCVEDATVLFRAQIKKYPRARLDLSLATGLPSVYGDPAQLGQVVLNLLHNGLQALDKGEGTLTVQTGSRDGHCFFTVTDDGCGIPQENLPRIFEPHFTTKPPGEGTGLGLSIAYRIVEDHGGHFSVDSKPDEGAAFTVMIPFQPQGA
ncbi:MAG: response regulator [Archangium sp.]|nr:response regulator [Archangium sp.]